MSNLFAIEACSDNSIFRYVGEYASYGEAMEDVMDNSLTMESPVSRNVWELRESTRPLDALNDSFQQDPRTFINNYKI